MNRRSLLIADLKARMLMQEIWARHVARFAPPPTEQNTNAPIQNPAQSPPLEVPADQPAGQFFDTQKSWED